MLGDRDDAETSPWSRDVPIPDAPVEFSWSSADREDPGGAIDELVDAPRRWSGRRRAIGLGLVAVFAIVAVSLMSGRGDRDPGDSDAGSAPAVTPRSQEDVELESETTAMPTTTGAPRRPGAEPYEPAVGGGVSDARRSDDATWSRNIVGLPDVLAAMTQPTTLVAVHTDGTISELDLPSGAIARGRSPIPSGEVLDVVVGRSASLVRSFDGRQYVVSAGQPAVALAVDIETPMAPRPGSDAFVGLTPDGAGRMSEVSVSSDGTVIERYDSRLGVVSPWSQFFLPNGNRLVQDAGGTYEVDVDGVARRFHDGLVLAAAGGNVLLRECDSAFDCRLLVVDAATGESFVSGIGADELSTWLGATSLSPDGLTVMVANFGESTGIEFLDTTTGDRVVAAVGLDRTLDPWSSWSADSQGIFVVDEFTVSFVDRSTGAITPLPSHTDVMRVGVRREFGPPEPPLRRRATGLTIAGLDNADGLVHIVPLDAPESITSYEVPPIGSGAPVYLFADETRLRTVAYDNVPTFELDFTTAEVTTLDPGPFGGLFLPGPRPGTGWRQRTGVDAAIFDLWAIDGGYVGESVLVDDSGQELTVERDGRGGLLAITELGGVFSIAPDGTRIRLTSGEVLALGESSALVRDCDDNLVCRAWHLDRDVGERSAVDNDAIARAGGNAAAGGLGTTMSPDGSVAIVRAGGFGTSWSIVDLDAGTTLPIPGVASETPIVWTADSSFALFLSSGTLRLYDRETNGLITLANLPTLRTFTLVPGTPGASPSGLVRLLR